MHKLLDSQLKKYFGSLENVPDELRGFIDEINISYQEAEQERVSLEQIVMRLKQPLKDSETLILPQAGATSGFRYQGAHVEIAGEPSPETRQAWTKGQMIVRRDKTPSGETNKRGARVAVPIKLRDQTLGAINLDFTDVNTAQQTTPLIEQITGRLALAIENARLFSDSQTSLSRTNALLQVSRSTIGFETIPDLLQDLSHIVAKVLPAHHVTLITLNTLEKRVTNYFSGGPGAGTIQFDPTYEELQQGLSGWVIREREPTLSPKNIPDPRESDAVRQKRLNANVGSIIVVPLIYRNEVIGTITAVNLMQERDFTDQDVELMVAMASQISVAIENTRLFQAQQQRTAELLAAAEVSRASSSILELDQLLNQTVEVIRERFGLYYVGIFLVDNKQEWAELRAGTGEAGRIQLERHHKLRVGGESMIGQSIRTSEARISQDVGDVSVRFKNPVLPETRSEMALPLISRGQTIGAMTIQSTVSEAFSQESITTLQTMADQMANAIQNVRLFEQTQLRARELGILNEMARNLTETRDEQGVVELVYTYASQLFDTQNFYVALYYAELDEIEFKLYTIDGKRVQIREPRRKAGKGLTEYVIRTRRPLFIRENLDEFLVNHPEVEAIGKESSSWLGVPMMSGNTVVGILNLQNYTTSNFFTDRDLELLTAVAGQTAIALQNARLFEQTQAQNQELVILNEMGSELNAILDRETIIEQTFDYTSRLFEMTTFALALYDPDREELTFPLVVENGQRLRTGPRPRKNGLMDYIINTKTALLLPDKIDERAQQLGIEVQTIKTTGISLHAWLAAPILTGNTVLGVLSVQTTELTTNYTERHRDLLTSLANLVANALENARLFEQTQLQNIELSVLNDMGRTLSSLLDKSQIFENILLFTSRLTDFTSFVVALYDHERDELSFPLVTEKEERLNISPAKGTNSLIGYVIRTKAPLLITENLQGHAESLGIPVTTVGEIAQSWLTVPVLVGKQVVGVISIQTVTTPRLYTERHQDLLTSISNQVATALQNADLFEQAQRQNNELALLNEMSRVLTTLLDVEAIIEQIYTYTTRLIQTTDFFVAMYDEATNQVSFPFVIDEGAKLDLPSRPLANSLTDYVIRSGSALLLKENMDAHISELGLDQQVVGTPSASWLGVPMSLGQQVIGVIGVQDILVPKAYSERDRDLLTAVAGQAAITLQNARSFEQTEQRNRDLGTLNEMGQVISTLLDVNEIIEKVHEYCSKLFDTNTFLFGLYDETSQSLTFPLTVNEGKRLPSRSRPLGNGFTDYVIRSQKPLLLEDNVPQRAMQLGLEQVIFGDARPAQSWLGVPIAIGDAAIGVISVQSLHTPRLYTPYHRDLLTTIASQTAITIQNAQLFHQTQEALEASTEQARRLAVLNQMSAALAQSANLEEVYNQAVTYVSRIYQADRVSFSLLISADQVEIRAASGRDAEEQIGQRHALARTANETVVNEKRIVILSNIQQAQEGAFRSIMIAPINVDGKILGTLNIGSLNPNAYQTQDENLLQQVVSLLGTLIANRQLFAQVENALLESENLYLASAELNAAQHYDDVLMAIRNHSPLGQPEKHIINLVSYDVPWTKTQVPQWLNILTRWNSYPVQEQPWQYPLKAFEWLVGNFKQDAPLYVSNADNLTSALDEHSQNFVTRFGFKSVVFLPMVVGGQWRGHISAFYPHPTDFSDADLRLMMSLAGQAAVAIQGLQNLELAQQRALEAQKRSEELAFVNRVVTLVSAAFDLQEGLNIIAQELGKSTGAGRIGIALLTETQTELKVVSEYRTSPDNPTAIGLTIPIEGNPATQQVLETKSPLFIENAQQNPILAEFLREEFKQRGIQSLVILPLLARGQVVGTIGLDILEKGKTFSRDELRLAEAVVLQASNAIYNAQLYEQTQQALAETEYLYKASGELNAVQNYEDVLSVLRRYTILGNKHASEVTINLFDRPWVENEVPEYLDPIARWVHSPHTPLPQTHFPLLDWPNLHDLLHSNELTFIEDIHLDERILKGTLLPFIHSIEKISSIVFTPLIVGRQWIGHVIGIFSKKITVSSAEFRRLTSLAQQSTIAIQNIRLLAESRRQAAQLLTAALIARSASETLAQEELLNRAVNLICERFGYYHASIFLLDDSRQWAVIRESTGDAGTEMKRQGHRLEVGSQSIIGTVTFTGDSLIVNDVMKDGVHRPNPLLPNTKAELGIPLKIGRRIIGALDVQSNDIDAFTEDDVAVLQILADQIAIAVDNARSYQIAQEAVRDANDRLEEISTLFEISEALASAPLLSEQIAEIIASRMIRILGSDSNCSISIYDPDTDMMRMLVDVSYVNGKPQVLENPARWDFKLSEFAASQKAMHTLQPIVIQQDDPGTDPIEIKYMQEMGVKTLLIMPLASKGEAFGLLEVETQNKKKSYTPEQLNLVLTVANQGASALENARLYEEQIRTAEQLREVDKLKNQFLANMSHELRTPLNSIIGFSRVILKGIDGPVTDMQEQDLNAIYSAGTHLLGLINDILDISRIEAGKMELAFEELDLAALIPSVMATAKGLVKEKPVRLDVEIEPSLPLVSADPTRLRQIILNLLQNAAKFTEHGSITVRAIRQMNKRGGMEVMVSVSDTGVGISPDDQKKLFQPFSQVDASPTRKAGGTGLGLSITRNLIELHGGRIDLISDVEKGSTFFFTLPALAPEVPEIGQAHQKGLDVIYENKRIVLAIEDDPQIIQLYQRYLEPEGYQIIPLTDPTKAVQQAKEIQPFAITLDVHMPNLDGWQVIRALKSSLETRGIPVIFCTIVENQAKGFSLGAADYLMKPILSEDLINALARLEEAVHIQHILVIDDDPDDLRLVEKALSVSGSYQIRMAQGGSKGLAEMRINKPDAVILDLSMPDIDGFKVLETMRADKQLKDIPVIILTALDLNPSQQQMLAEYTQDMLRKGFLDTDGLLACLQHALKKTQEHSTPE